MAGQTPIPGARRAAFPAAFKPQLATLADGVPPGEDWLYEIKYDGYRIIAMIERGRVRLLTRRGNDWTDKFPTVAAALKKLKVKSAILDGELVALDANGVSSFQMFQSALDPQAARRPPLHYFVFDLPYCDGLDLSGAAQSDRKQALEGLLGALPGNGLVRFSAHIKGKGEATYAHACKRGLEGLIAKRADAPYEQRRTKSWLKVKCSKRQEFVIAGYTDPERSRENFGALLLGYYDDTENLHYCGRVGTGFTHESLREILKRMKPLEVKTCPCADPPRGAEARGAHWLKPKLVGEVQFTEWTVDDKLRHPSFQGLRLDKTAGDVRRERPVDADKPEAPAKSPKKEAAMPAAKRTSSTKSSSKNPRPELVAGVKITHPDRVLWTETGVTKADLARYYEAVADYIMPHLARRPLSLLRCPEGPAGQCFFQKHIRKGVPAGLHGIQIQEKDAIDTYHIADGIAGVVGLVQLGALEFHTWGSREPDIERPDRVIFDLDPAPDVPWSAVVDAARALRKRLEQEGLKPFVKSSGGKGLHVVAPLVKRGTWAGVREFSEAVARKMAADEPAKFVAVMTKAKRGGKIFVDYLRNQRGATCVAAFSARARAGAPVSAPLAWNELGDDADDVIFTVQTLPARLKRHRKDPWADYFKNK